MKGKHHKGKKSPAHSLETNVREKKTDGVFIFLGQNEKKTTEKDTKKEGERESERVREKK